ncbi:hypothetical protein B0H10DRAFT_699145 [Mycena sp. CBHHK59/15]|nr:hypothetical protein B0H10DRAFT_699145 [Mycena sp. CBHHK59/15]
MIFELKSFISRKCPVKAVEKWVDKMTDNIVAAAVALLRATLFSSWVVHPARGPLPHISPSPLPSRTVHASFTPSSTLPGVDGYSVPLVFWILCASFSLFTAYLVFCTLKRMGFTVSVGEFMVSQPKGSKIRVKRTGSVSASFLVILNWLFYMSVLAVLVSSIIGDPSGCQLAQALILCGAYMLCINAGRVATRVHQAARYIVQVARLVVLPFVSRVLAKFIQDGRYIDTSLLVRQRRLFQARASGSVKHSFRDQDWSTRLFVVRVGSSSFAYCVCSLSRRTPSICRR